MAYASRMGRARVSASNPQAAGVCDRCGIWVTRSTMLWQYQWRGAELANIRILVCSRCLDTPQEQLRAIIVPADPVPIIQPRTENFLADETDYHTVTQPSAIDPRTGIPIPGTTTFLTQNGLDRVELPYGRPDDIAQGAVQPLFESRHYGVPLSLMSVTSLGSDQIFVTCSAAHGLANNAQIIVDGLSNASACGAYSVTALTPMAFAYQTFIKIPAGPLLTGSTKMITALVGLPRDFQQLAQL